MRILLIDDDVLVVRCIARLMRGADVTCETDPEAALHRLRAGEHFDLVLCDHNMPKVYGTEVLREARARLGRDALLVLMSGADELPETCGDAILLKPFSRHELEGVLACVREVEDHRRSSTTQRIQRLVGAA